MTVQGTLFDVRPRYCLDTNVVVSFLSTSEDEHYGGGGFEAQWQVFERLISEGAIVAPEQVREELEKWKDREPAIAEWARHRHLFRAVTTDQLLWAKRIVNAYPAYARDRNYLGDLMVISLAGAIGLTVVTLEHAGETPSLKHPKIPHACAKFEVACTTVPGLLREASRARSGSDHPA